MILSFILLASLQAPIQGALLQPVALQVPFSVPPTIAEPNRLEMTPKLDGKLDEEEWDPLTTAGALKGYMQWEPHKLHLAAVVPAGQDLVVSLDTKGDGWLVGSDNLELRFTMKDGKPRMTARQLDATAVSGPVWKPMPTLETSTQLAASADAAGWTVEATLEDPGTDVLPGRDDKPGIRMDALASIEPPAQPFLPRALGQVRLVSYRSTALPAGLTFNPQDSGKAVTPGEDTKIRLTFHGSDAMGLKRVEMRSEGFAKEATNAMAVNFPGFDRKGRAFVDYGTPIAPGSSFGYRVLRGVVTGTDGVPAVVQTCYHVAPIITFDLAQQQVETTPATRTVRFAVFLHSHTSKRLDGTIKVTAPWKVVSGDNDRFILFNSHAGIRRVFELEIPGNAEGTFAIRFQGRVGATVIGQTQWLTVGG